MQQREIIDGAVPKLVTRQTGRLERGESGVTVEALAAILVAPYRFAGSPLVERTCS